MMNMEKAIEVAAIKDRLTLTPNYKFNGVPVWHAPNVVKAAGSIVTAVLELKDGGYGIVYDDIFQLASPDTQQFALYQALGYVENDAGVMSDKEFAKYTILSNILISERQFNADRRVMEKIGLNNCISAMRELENIIGLARVKRQMRNRIMALKLYNTFHKKQINNTRVYYSISNPGLYYICDGKDISKDLKLAESLQLVMTSDMKQFVLSNKDNFREIQGYQDTYVFDSNSVK